MDTSNQSNVQSKKRKRTNSNKPEYDPKLTKDYEEELEAAKEKFSRGSKPDLENITRKKLKARMTKDETIIEKTTSDAAKLEVLLSEDVGYLEVDGMNAKTWKVSQTELKESVSLISADKIFDLKLGAGPYALRYTPNGTYLLLGGIKGHLALIDWKENNLIRELQVREMVNDVTFLHNETMFAVAQRQNVYIYDKNGIEIHRLKALGGPMHLEYLNYHFLLVTAYKTGILHYQDTSVGKSVAKHDIKNKCFAITQNPHNAVIHAGQNNGIVSLWSPSIPKALVKIQCHKGTVQSLCVDTSGTTLITAGLDGLVKVWDIRMYKPLSHYYTRHPVKSLSMSQTGLMAMGYGSHVQVYKNFIGEKAKEPYMAHKLPWKGHIKMVQFCPFEDVLGIGHDWGFSSTVIPGAGEPSFDTFESNPFQNKRQRRETTVVRLLEKLPPETIRLDPNEIGSVRSRDIKIAEKKEAVKTKYVPKFKARGRNAPSKIQTKKRFDARSKKFDEIDKSVQKIVDEEKEKARKRREIPPAPENALNRFTK